MQQKTNPAIIGVAIVLLLVFCFFMYKRNAGGGSPEQLPSPSTTFKPGYSGGTTPARPTATGAASSSQSGR